MSEKQNDAEDKIWRLREWFSDLPDEAHGKLRNFQIELIRFNGRMNLISPQTERLSDQIHFADCVLGGRIVLRETSAERIFDIGSGNGLPGLVMAILAPERKFVLIDRDARKVEFLKHMIDWLDLKNTKAIHSRIEDIEKGSVSCAVSRAFAPLFKAVVSVRHAFPKGGEYFHFKGSGWATEVSRLPSQVCAVWQPSLVDQYDLPDAGPHMAVVLTKKIA